MKEQHPDLNLDLENDFIKHMKNYIIDTFESNKHKLNPNCRKNCFEIFGYDFMIDEDLRTWLIEVYIFCIL